MHSASASSFSRHSANQPLLLPSCATCCPVYSPRCCSLHVAKLFFACRYTLLKGLELSKAAAQGLNRVLGDKHEKSREAKDVYREFLSKKQVLLPASPRVGDVSRAGQIAGSPISSPANSSRN